MNYRIFSDNNKQGQALHGTAHSHNQIDIGTANPRANPTISGASILHFRLFSIKKHSQVKGKKQQRGCDEWKDSYLTVTLLFSGAVNSLLLVQCFPMAKSLVKEAKGPRKTKTGGRMNVRPQMLWER